MRERPKTYPWDGYVFTFLLLLFFLPWLFLQAPVGVQPSQSHFPPQSIPVFSMHAWRDPHALRDETTPWLLLYCFLSCQGFLNQISKTHLPKSESRLGFGRRRCRMVIVRVCVPSSSLFSLRLHEKSSPLVIHVGRHGCKMACLLSTKEALFCLLPVPPRTNTKSSGVVFAAKSSHHTTQTHSLLLHHRD